METLHWEELKSTNQHQHQHHRLQTGCGVERVPSSALAVCHFLLDEQIWTHMVSAAVFQPDLEPLCLSAPDTPANTQAVHSKKLRSRGPRISSSTAVRISCPSWKTSSSESPQVHRWPTYYGTRRRRILVALKGPLTLLTRGEKVEMAPLFL